MESSLVALLNDEEGNGSPVTGHGHAGLSVFVDRQLGSRPNVDREPRDGGIGCRITCRVNRPADQQTGADHRRGENDYHRAEPPL